MRRTITAVLLLAMVGWWLFFTFVQAHVHDVSAHDYAEFIENGGEETLPESATNIRFVRASVSIRGFAYIGRFEAPLADCKTFTRVEFKSFDVQEDGDSGLVFTPISNRPSRPDLSGYGITNLAWFDVENIRNGITLNRDHSYRPTIWIDTDRNVLYIYWRD